MKTIINVLIISQFILMNGCAKSDNSELVITGTWIEISEKSDTIDFTKFGSELALNLRRGLVLINDYWLPNYGSGFYAYELQESDSIALCYSLSSSCISGLPKSYSKYFFKLSNNNTFKITNFYNPDISPNTIFTFSRIE